MVIKPSVYTLTDIMLDASSTTRSKSNTHVVLLLEPLGRRCALLYLFWTVKGQRKLVIPDTIEILEERAFKFVGQILRDSTCEEGFLTGSCPATTCGHLGDLGGFKSTRHWLLRGLGLGLAGHGNARAAVTCKGQYHYILKHLESVQVRVMP